MNVEDREINGFAIDKFNQHSLDVGKPQGTCPLCSADRKPENQKAKCASYDWERGLGTCHIVIPVFSCTRINAKELAKRSMLGLSLLAYRKLKQKLNNGLKQEAYLLVL